MSAGEQRVGVEVWQAPGWDYIGLYKSSLLSLVRAAWLRTWWWHCLLHQEQSGNKVIMEKCKYVKPIVTIVWRKCQNVFLTPSPVKKSQRDYMKTYRKMLTQRILYTRAANPWKRRHHAGCAPFLQYALLWTWTMFLWWYVTLGMRLKALQKYFICL